MVKKTITLRIRIPVYLYKLLDDLAIKQDVSVSELIRVSSEKLFDKDDMSMQNELKLMIVKIKRKNVISKYYITKNMYKRILDMAMSNYFIANEINMRAINDCIDEYVKEFELYDDKIKKAIGTDFKLTVRRLRNQNFLLQQSDTIKKLKLIEKR